MVQPIITISDHCSLNTVEGQHLPFSKYLLFIAIVSGFCYVSFRDVYIDVYLNNVYNVMEMNKQQFKEFVSQMS